MKDKGIDFAVNRLIVHLQRHYRKYGNNGYALVFDFSKYFDSINHDKLKSIIDDSYPDKRLAAFIKRLVDDFGGEKGLGLGSQISQVSALRFPNQLDHYVKEVLHIKGYGRYMDDGYMLFWTKKEAKEAVGLVISFCEPPGHFSQSEENQDRPDPAWFQISESKAPADRNGKG